MGWAYCGLDEYGREIGYGIIATCDKKGCDNVIHRGLDYVCGTMHGGEGGCGMYFCYDHQDMWPYSSKCGHRQIHPYGNTMCQPMREDRGKGKLYCACHFDHYVEWNEDPMAIPGLGVNCLKCGLPVVCDFYCYEHLPDVIREMYDKEKDANNI